MKPSISILLVCANPIGTDPVRLGEEDRTLRESIQLSTSRERFAVTTLNAVTIDDLRRGLMRKQYDIVHFSGHGTREGLAFEDSEGRTVVPDPVALAELLRRRGVRTVVLNACYSLNSLARGGLGTECTIAMDGPIADRAAIEFSRGFYDALGEGLSVEEAHAEGLSCCKLKHLTPSAALLRKGEEMPEKEPEGTGELRAEGPERRLLLGVAVDTSGSMRSSIQNNKRGSLSRLSAVTQGLGRLARGMQKRVSTQHAGKGDPNFRVFVYAFGLRHALIADLLSVVRATESVDVRDEVERRKRFHEQKAREGARGLEGWGSLARSYGFGGIVDGLARSARAGAEASIRQQIVAEIADLIMVKVREAGDTTFNATELADLFNRSDDRDLLDEVEQLIYGETPMLTVAREICARFARTTRQPDEERLLLIVSDGDPTDGDPTSEFERIKQDGVTITSCYVTNSDVANPRLLLSRPDSTWPRGALLMFQAASTIDQDGAFAQHLRQKGWTIESGSRLFIQANHSDVLEEFIQIAGNPHRSLQSVLPEGH